MTHNEAISTIEKERVLRAKCKELGIPYGILPLQGPSPIVKTLESYRFQERENLRLRMWREMREKFLQEFTMLGFDKAPDLESLREAERIAVSSGLAYPLAEQEDRRRHTTPNDPESDLECIREAAGLPKKRQISAAEVYGLGANCRCQLVKNFDEPTIVESKG